MYKEIGVINYAYRSHTLYKRWFKNYHNMQCTKFLQMSIRFDVGEYNLMPADIYGIVSVRINFDFPFRSCAWSHHGNSFTFGNINWWAYFLLRKDLEPTFWRRVSTIFSVGVGTLNNFDNYLNFTVSFGFTSVHPTNQIGVTRVCISARSPIFSIKLPFISMDNGLSFFCRHYRVK